MFTIEAVSRKVLGVFSRLLPVAVRVAWRAPWLVANGLGAAGRMAASLRALPTQFLIARSDTIRCHRCGTTQSLLGRWRCPVCKGASTTHAKAPCGICGARYPGGYITCERQGCGEAISILGGFR